MEQQEPSLARKTSPRVCMYAGGVSKQYGLENLVKGFRKADLPDARLEMCIRDRPWADGAGA